MGKKKVSEKNVLAENFGQHFGKPDLARWGDFAEMSYLHGAPYVFPSVSKQRGVGKQMLPGFPKMKTGLQDCYFDKEFKRIFIKEGYTSAYKIDAKTRMESAKHFITPQGFKYSNHTKWHSTPGDFYGTFGGIVEAFSPKQRPRKPREPEKRNALTSPGKKGSYGYADICINKYPEYISGDKYDVKAKPIFYSKTNPAFKGPSKPGYFDSNPYPEPCKDGAECAIKPFYKKYYDERWVKFGPFFPVGNGKPLGGHKGGGFEPFPKYSADKYYDRWKIERIMKKKDNEKLKGKIFYPPIRNISRPVYSIVNLNIDKKTHAQNYRTMKPITFTREILG